MRVLFLDYDGVLHPLGCRMRRGTLLNGAKLAEEATLDFFCWAPVLTRLLEAHPDVHLVVHSSWRASHSEEALGGRAYLGALSDRYLGAANPEIEEKGEAILAWLADHPEVTEFRVLDDYAPDFRDDDKDWEELVLCDPETGLLEDAVQRKLTSWLEATEPTE